MAIFFAESLYIAFAFQKLLMQKLHFCSKNIDVQLTLIISNLFISNNRLCWNEIQVPVLTWKSKNR